MRLFVAAWPSSAVVAALARMPRPELAGVRWTSERQWHVTLRFLGDIDDPRPFLDELSAVLGDIAPATVVLDRRARRFGPAVVGVPVHGLDAVAAAVQGATSGAQVGDRRPFRGHLTLARCKGRIPAAALSVGLPSLRWTLGEIALVRSHLGAAGGRYETLSTVELRGTAPSSSTLD